MMAYFTNKDFASSATDYCKNMKVGMTDFILYAEKHPDFHVETVCVYLDRKNGLTDTKYPKMIELC